MDKYNKMSTNWHAVSMTKWLRRLLLIAGKGDRLGQGKGMGSILIFVNYMEVSSYMEHLPVSYS